MENRTLTVLYDKYREVLEDKQKFIENFVKTYIGDIQKK